MSTLVTHGLNGPLFITKGLGSVAPPPPVVVSTPSGGGTSRRLKKTTRTIRRSDLAKEEYEQQLRAALMASIVAANPQRESVEELEFDMDDTLLLLVAMRRYE